jgi:hypothetical protein
MFVEVMVNAMSTGINFYERGVSRWVSAVNAAPAKKQAIGARRQRHADLRQTAADNRRVARIMVPTPKKPVSISAQKAGSGTPVASMGAMANVPT